MEKNNLSFNAVNAILSESYQGDSMNFKKGFFEYPTGDALLRAESILKQVEDLQTYFPSIKKYTRWILAVLDVNKIPNYERAMLRWPHLRYCQNCEICWMEDNPSKFVTFYDVEKLLNNSNV